MQHGRQGGDGRPGAALDLEGRVTTLLRRFAVVLVTVVAACVQLAGANAARAQHPNVARGFSPSGMFDVGGLDVVNGFNGNLVITIPIGQKYPVGGLLGSYSFSLVYNSNVWSHDVVDEGGGIEATQAISDPLANAGLGWRFSLGRLGTDFGGFEGPVNNEDNDYFAQDGSEHALYGAPSDPAWFSTDGSHLRFLSASRELDFPDGMRHTFSEDGYPLSILDQLGNGLQVSYVPFPAPNQDLYSEWDIQDTSGTPGRIHRVYFRLTGYSGNEQRAVVDHIDLQAFNGGVATYTFLYNDETAPGVGTQTVRMTGDGTMDPAGWNPRVFLLTKLLLPEASGYRPSYRMPVASYQAQHSNPDGHPGPINGMTFPTAGLATWSYTVMPLPQPNNRGKPPLNAIWNHAVAVATRSLFDAGGNRIGDWNYSGTPTTGIPGNEILRTLVYPPADPSSSTPGHRVVTYYSTCVHATCFGSGTVADTYAVEYGLPFSRLQTGDGAGRFLSQQIFEPGAANPIRSVYVTYENDGNPTGSDEPIYANQRQQSERTFYLDDPLGTAKGGTCTSQPSACSSVTTDSSDYDGFGHYRQQATSDTFGIGTPHTARTEWNQFLPGPPANNLPWILDTYTYKQQQEGLGVERQEAFFEQGTGFLQCSRRLKSGTTRSVHDVVVTADRDGSGNVLVERWYGGDTRTVSTAGTCPGGSDVPAYTFSHTYASGARSTTTVQLATSQTLSLLNLAIDPGSGLPSMSTDPSGVPTTFTYDAMGRLLTTSPRGDATTTVTYQLGEQTPPRVTRTVGQGLEQETWQLDGLGRTVQEAVTLPGTSGAATTATRYNALGWKLLVTEPSSGIGTSFQGYDAFGRPGTVTTADGKYTSYGYTGVRTVSRTSYVQQRTQQKDAYGHLVWVTGELPAVTRETYDGRGQLMEVMDPSGTRTHYHYEVGGRLEAVLTAASSGGQVRTFQYDGRGFLVREVSPEGGAVSYRYDPRGNVTQRTDTTGSVFSTYDAAGRLLAVDSTASGSSIHLKKLEYDTAANGTGKLATAHAYNWRSADSCTLPYEVRQDMTYDPGHGRLSSETTKLLHGSSLESWVQSYVYDGAGRITTTTYPTCLAMCTAPARTATTAYSYGRPVSVSGFVSSITYNPNGTLATIHHMNNVTFTQQPDPTGMPRPASLGVTAPANVWFPEAYSYDSSGNVTQIGGKSFTYDPDSRLLSATQPLAGPNPYQELTYDAFGNIIRVSSGTAPGNTPTHVSYDTDVATNHLTAASYDPSGTLHSFQLSTYLWDRFQQLTDVKTPAETWVHIYGAMGERVWSWRTSPSRLDTYALRGQDGHVLSLFTKTGSTYTWEDYVYREGQLLGSQASSSGAVTHDDVDHLGSLRLESDQGGQHFTPHEYWPFGEEITSTASTERMRFTGHERDLADDIDYLHARYYKPPFGRFLSPDVASGKPKAPQSWNRYAYTEGNPVKYIDPNGRDTTATISGPSYGDPITAADASLAKREAVGGLVVAGGIAGLFAAPEIGAALNALAVKFPSLFNAAVSLLEGETGAPSTGSQVTGTTLKDLLSPNKLNHIFDGEGHGLENLVANFGGEQQLTVKVVEQLGALGPLPTNSNGIFKVVVEIAGQVVTVTGKVVDGVARVGTFYVVR
jgi:RHS repeat-associated protein